MQVTDEDLARLKRAAREFGLEVDRLYGDLPRELRIDHVSRLANEFVAQIVPGTQLHPGETRARLEKEARDLLFAVLEEEGGFAPGELDPSSTPPNHN